MVFDKLWLKKISKSNYSYILQDFFIRIFQLFYRANFKLKELTWNLKGQLSRKTWKSILNMDFQIIFRISWSIFHRFFSNSILNEHRIFFSRKINSQNTFSPFFIGLAMKSAIIKFHHQWPEFHSRPLITKHLPNNVSYRSQYSALLLSTVL